MVATAGSATAQTFNSAYFTDDFKYRHELNPAIENSQSYVAIPVLGNLHFKTQSNVGVSDFLFPTPDNRRYTISSKKTTTFLNPDIPTSEALKGFNDGSNRFVSNVDVQLVSVGFKAFGGYNTVGISAKSTAGFTLPGTLFQLMRNVENKVYDFDHIGARAYAYGEVALGHSRQLTKDLRVGAKFKFLLGGAMAEAKIKDMQLQLNKDGNWLVNTGTSELSILAGGVTFEEKDNDYKSIERENEHGKHIDLGSMDVDGGDLVSDLFKNVGVAVDLGATYKVMDGLTLSAAITDLGFMSFGNGKVYRAAESQYTFNGFKDVAVKDDGSTETFENQVDKLVDDVSDLYNLQEAGASSVTKWLATTINIGAEYELPVYKKLTFGFLGQQRFDGPYSWTEARLSANWKPLKWVSASLTGAVNTFGTNMGWVLNFHPVGMNVFLGMDYTFFERNQDFIPVGDANTNFNFGMNVAF